MKIAVTGKGGVGKTTFSAGLSLYLSSKNNRVLAMDCDPDSNLLSTLGYKNFDDVPAVCENKDLIKERTKDDGAGFFLLNPEVGDIAAKYAVNVAGVDVLVMGKVKKAEEGCYCSENSFTRNLVRHLLLKKDEYIVMDMEAGVEHLTRGTAKHTGLTFIVAEPMARAFETAGRIKKLLLDLGVINVFLCGSSVAGSDDEKYIRENSEKLGIKYAGSVGYSEELKKNGGIVAPGSSVVTDAGKIFETAKELIPKD